MTEETQEPWVGRSRALAPGPPDAVNRPRGPQRLPVQQGAASPTQAPPGLSVLRLLLGPGFSLGCCPRAASGCAPPPMPQPRLLGPSNLTPSKKGFCGSSPEWGAAGIWGLPLSSPTWSPPSCAPARSSCTCEFSIKLLPSLTSPASCPLPGHSRGWEGDLEA